MQAGVATALPCLPDRITGRVDEMIYPEYFNPGNGRDQGAQACLFLSIKELFFEFER